MSLTKSKHKKKAPSIRPRVHLWLELHYMVLFSSLSLPSAVSLVPSLVLNRGYSGNGPLSRSHCLKCIIFTDRSRTVDCKTSSLSHFRVSTVTILNWAARGSVAKYCTTHYRAFFLHDQVTIENGLLWSIDRAESHKMWLLKAFCVNLCWASFLGVLRGADSKPML